MHIGIEYLLGTVKKVESTEVAEENPIMNVNPVEEKESFNEDPYEDQVGEDLLKLLFDEEKLPQMTDLNNDLVIHLSRAEFMADRYKSPKLRNYCIDVMKRRISLKREGRKEASHLLSSTFDRALGYDPTPVGLFDSLFAGKGK